MLAHVGMIIEGPSIKKDKKEPEEEEDQVRTAALTISRLLSFNSRRHIKGRKTVRHEEKIHGEKRKRSLINIMHNLGLCISYDWVMDIAMDLANSVLAWFEQGVVVCPETMKRCVHHCQCQQH